MVENSDFTRDNFEELLRINNDLRRKNNDLLDDIKNYRKDAEGFLADRENFLKDLEMLRGENNELKKELRVNRGETKIRPPAVNAIYLLSKDHYQLDKFVAKDLLKKLDALVSLYKIDYSFELKTVEAWCTEFKKMDAK